MIKDGQTVAIGGFGADNHPMAIVREIIRTGNKNLTIIASATAGLEIDLLIGAGCVKKLIAPYVGQEMYCPIGHNYRKYAESGQIEVRETSEYILYAGLFAAASGQEFFAWRGGVGTSIPELNPDLVEFIDPIGKTKKIIAVPPLRAGLGDHPCRLVGRLRQRPASRRALRRPLARARRRSHHDADRARRSEFGDPQKSVHDHDRLRRRAWSRRPYGGHPYAAHGFYKEDVEFIQDYVKCSEANRKGDAARPGTTISSGTSSRTTTLISTRSASRSCSRLYTHPIVSW